MSATHSERGIRPRRGAWIFAAVATAATISIGWFGLRPTAPTKSDHNPPPKAIGAPANQRDSPNPFTGSIRLRPGETPRIHSASLTPDAKVAVTLALPDVSPEVAVKSIRLYSEGRNPQTLTGQRLDGGEMYLELKSAWLTPGKYILELQTDERHAIPLRRYALEVD